MTDKLAQRASPIGALVLGVVLPILGLAITNADPRFRHPCHPNELGVVEHTYPTPTAALVLCWLAVALAVADVAYGGWRRRASITVFGMVLLLFNGLALWVVYGTWVGVRTDCGW